MMKAWAAVSAAAVLVALPAAVQSGHRSAAPGGAVDTPAPVAGSGIADTAISATDLGMMLWLAVGLVAIVTAVLVLRHSRTSLRLADGVLGADGDLPGASTPTAGR